MLTDTHSHIYSEEFDGDRNETIARAEAAGVGLILLPAIDRDSYGRQEALAEERPDLFRQMMGLHPTSVDDCYKENLAFVGEKLYDSPDKYIGIGEIGLDFYWDTHYREQQIEALLQQMEWACELDKPVVLHLRSGNDGNAVNDAYAELFRQTEQFRNKNLRGIMHCFGGTLSDAVRAVEMGFLLGIGGVVTYKNSKLPDIVRTIPLQSIVLETDAPYLAPVPYRGRRNESAYVSIVAQKVAELKECSFEEVAETTTANAKSLFRI